MTDFILGLVLGIQVGLIIAGILIIMFKGEDKK